MICFSVNWAAGLVEGTLDFEAIKANMNHSVKSLVKLLGVLVLANKF